MKKAEITIEISNAFAFHKLPRTQQTTGFWTDVEIRKRMREVSVSLEILPKYVQNGNDIILTASKRHNRKEVIDYLKKHLKDLNKVRINIRDFLVETPGKRKN